MDPKPNCQVLPDPATDQTKVSDPGGSGYATLKKGGFFLQIMNLLSKFKAIL